MNITAKTIPLGVIGHPIAHSISPEIHNVIIDCMELNYFYCAYHVLPENLPAALEGVRALGIRGLNVTVPHKEGVFRLCDGLDPYAEKIGAVNTIVNENGSLKGYNTDAQGFMANLRRSGVSPEGKRVVIMGAGGAAKGVATALLENGASELRIVNRTRERAEKMASELSRYYGNRIKAADSAEGAQILVNTTSVGMKSSKTPFTDFGILNKNCVVCDIVYCPRETEFLRLAAEKGHKTVGGIGMLIYQAVIAFELFAETKVRDDIIEKLFRRLEMKRSVVLTGFMGCGKSAIGRELAQMSGTDLVDCDDYIVQKCGKTIPQIFDEVGEQGFRDIESQCIRELSERSGVIISLGGGAVLRRENIDLLRERCLVFRIKASVDKILRNTSGDTNRPLLRGKSKAEIEAMLDYREPYYQNCDYTIDVSKMYPNQSAKRIMDVIMNEE
ncbi:MAG: shikimate dehydrogenase [Clostridia bacterium]